MSVPNVLETFFRGRRIRLHEPVVSLRLPSLPRCALELLRFKSSSMTDAQEGLQELLVDLKMI
jgi:hypothetical protein